MTKEAEIAQMLRDTEIATEKRKKEIEAQEEALPMSPLKTKNAGKSPIYDTKTGGMSWSMDNMLPHQLKKLHKDGTLRFTVYDPHIAQVRGQYKCMLHKDGPDREFYDTLYLPICNKDNITSPYQVQRHMQKRHKMELASIISEKEKKEKEEDRQLQRDMIMALTGKATDVVKNTPTAVENTAEEAPVYVSDKPPKARKKK